MKQRILVDFAPERLEDQHSPSTYVMSCPRGEVESQEWAILLLLVFSTPGVSSALEIGHKFVTILSLCP